MLWHCWLGGEKGIRSVKKLALGGVLAWLSVCSKVQICIWPSLCHCHSCSSKSRLVVPFWYWLTQVVPDKGPLNGCCSSQLKTFYLVDFTADCFCRCDRSDVLEVNAVVEPGGFWISELFLLQSRLKFEKVHSIYKRLIEQQDVDPTLVSALPLLSAVLFLLTCFFITTLSDTREILDCY